MGPFLHQYFGKMQALMVSMADPEAMMEIAMDPNAERKMKEKVEKFAKECEPLLRKSFQHHNVSGSGTLSPEEASAFFDHLIHEEGDFTKAVASQMMSKAIAGM